MAHVKGHDSTAHLYLLTCSRCEVVHNPPLTSRRASDARHQARRDGWRVHNAPRRRKQHPDLCPDCRKETR